MIRTKIIPCNLPIAKADALNLESGQIYTGILVRHWRIVRKKGIWLSEKSGTKLSDLNTDAPMHAHSIDAAQQGFYKACKITKALKQTNPNARYPHWTKKFRTTIWKNTAIKFRDNTLELSTGRNNPKITIQLPFDSQGILRFAEVRLVYDKKARRYNWHIVMENGKKTKQTLSANIVSVDPGEIHPAVIGDEASATIITCRERRSVQRGHAKSLAFFNKALSRKTKGSKRYKKLLRSKTRCKAKYDAVMRDMEHKISRAIIEEAAERKASTIVYGDVRNIADGINKGKKHNQRMSQWNHGKIRSLVEYKAAEEGISVTLQSERYTSKTCPNCGNRYKPKGRTYKCPSCEFQSHRDVVGQINILSAYKFGEPGKIPAPAQVKYRIPHNVRVLRKCRDTGQGLYPVARKLVFRETAGV